ncbi:protein kinase domain-containing protein [Chitinophaga pinensis]|uniref:Serine/threonine protein kinase n=1 Tax=Chitinophaga pinensis (strain ATCC 43595 / DSM 2588 / LMG 13176 / NBRC 15968 / NCIMB 11800 / UQM 2034) TaxID=485918 RepID=A0A979G0C1_CHIPD|nr:lanthionine synthetase LanC family protein [Chitinophaga pinensis]ACU58480.1 serine/threonine protein kinase [Chitinophaga pinensis DSM 2588]
MEALTEIIVDDPSLLEKKKSEKKSGNRIGYYYIIIKSLKESLKNDVVKCFYIKGITNFGLCVIKEGTYGDSKDREGRDIKDRLIWQQKLHRELQDLVRIPRLLGSFEENNNYYLVIEYIKGKSLLNQLKIRKNSLAIFYADKEITEWSMIDYVDQIAKFLKKLHELDYVHRDVTPANFIVTPGEKVCAIDMELSYYLKDPDVPPFQLGTFGYMSPQQKNQSSPSKEDDIYSVGAILFEAITGINPLKVMNCSTENVQSKINLLIRDSKTANLLSNCLHQDPSKRPSLQEISDELTSYKKDLKSGKESYLNTTLSRINKDEIKATIENTINTLSSPLFADETKGWFSENLHAEEINNDKNKINKAWYASFGLGAAGIIYTLSNAYQHGFNVESTKPYVEIGMKSIEEKYINSTTPKNPSLLFGSSGIAFTIGKSIETSLISDDAKYRQWIKELINPENSSLNLSHGIAGQGLAMLNLQDTLDTSYLMTTASEYVHRILAAQEKNGTWTSEGESKRLLNVSISKGSSGILLFLIEYLKLTKDNHVLSAVEKGLRQLMITAEVKRDYIFWKSQSGKALKYNFLDGNSGIALLLLKAYEVLGASQYKDYAQKILMAIKPQIIHNNLSYGGGLSGLGDIYLKFAGVLKNDIWKDRADWIANLVMQLGKDDSIHGNYWLTDRERQPVANFMTGNGGIIHFLVNYYSSL